MKKLAALLMIPVLAMLMVPALASADDHGHWGAIHHIKGVYAVTGFTTCNPTGPGIFEGDYTFNGNGTGSAEGLVRSISVNQTPPPFPGPFTNAGVMKFTVTFEYDVAHDGKITFQYPAYGFTLVSDDGLRSITWDQGPSHGVISPDGKTITITCGPPVQLKAVASTGPPLPSPGTLANCVTTAVGVRLR